MVEAAMKVTADTNVLVRAIVGDDPQQSRTAQALLARAESVAIAVPCLCELVWVLSSGYGISRSDIAEAVRRLLSSDKVIADRLAVEAGMSVLLAGGDFADGVIAYEGRWLGGSTFASFDSKAARILESQGESVQLLT